MTSALNTMNVLNLLKKQMVHLYICMHTIYYYNQSLFDIVAVIAKIAAPSGASAKFSIRYDAKRTGVLITRPLRVVLCCRTLL